MNLLSPGERVLGVTAGEFGNRWVALARAYGADVQELRYAWGETPQPDDVRARLEETGAEVAFLVHSETSTGVVADIQALAHAARDAGALPVVDAVSSLGAVPLETDAWGLDVVVSGSQKALMTPPGLSLVDRLARRVGAKRARDAPALLLRLGEAPRLARDRNDAVHAGRHARRVARRRARAPPRGGAGGGLRAPRGARPSLPGGREGDGLALFSPDEERSAVVTAILTPDGVDARELVLELRDRFGITVAGAHGELGARMFRIGHIGHYDVFDITTALAAVEVLLAERGADIERGAAVARARRGVPRGFVSEPDAARPRPRADRGVRPRAPAQRFDVVEDSD